MYQYKRWMIGLDFTMMDKTVISYVSDLAARLKPEKIYFVHAQANMDHDEELHMRFPELSQPVDEQMQEKMEKEVLHYFKPLEGCELEYQVLEGSPFEELLEWSTIKLIDLVILGRKRKLRGSGIMPQLLARKVMCSVLFIPENRKFELDDMLVSTDFSDYAQLALDEAISIARQNADATVYAFNGFTLPTGYYKTGKSEEEFCQIMHDNAIKKYNHMIAETDVDDTHIAPLLVFDSKNDPAVMINETAHKKKVDLILIGARGRTATTALFLGSVAEKLLAMDKDIPLLIVKDKKKTFNFLELLKNI